MMEISRRFEVCAAGWFMRWAPARIITASSHFRNSESRNNRTTDGKIADVLSDAVDPRDLNHQKHPSPEMLVGFVSRTVFRVGMPDATGISSDYPDKKR